MSNSTATPAVPEQTSSAGTINHEIVVVQVEGHIHRVLKQYLVDHSQMFKDMFSLPPGPNVEGTSESNPIVMSGCTNEEFTSLMSLLAGPKFEPLRLTQAQWISILKLATMWDMPQVRTFAITCVSKALNPLGKVLYGRKFRVKEWFLEGCLAITRPGGRQPIGILAQALGWETTARILDACQRTSEEARLTGVEIPLGNFRCDNCLPSLRVKDADAVQTLSRRLEGHDLVLTALPVPGEWAQEWSCGNCKASGTQVSVGGKLTLDMTGVVGSVSKENLDIVKEIFKKDLDDLSQ